METIEVMERAARAVVRKHRAHVIERGGICAMSVDDIRQEAFLAMLTAKPREGGSPPVAWLSQVGFWAVSAAERQARTPASIPVGHHIVVGGLAASLAVIRTQRSAVNPESAVVCADLLRRHEALTAELTAALTMFGKTHAQRKKARRHLASTGRLKDLRTRIANLEKEITT